MTFLDEASLFLLNQGWKRDDEYGFITKANRWGVDATLEISFFEESNEFLIAEWYFSPEDGIDYCAVNLFSEGWVEVIPQLLELRKGFA